MIGSLTAGGGRKRQRRGAGRGQALLELGPGELAPPAHARIGRHLGLSEKTVRNNVSVLLSKLEVADRAEAIARGRRAGLGLDPG